MATRGLTVALYTLLTTSASATSVPQRRQTAISTIQIESYKSYTYYAASAYCMPDVTLAWTCGCAPLYLIAAEQPLIIIIICVANCQANPGFTPVASGGDGSDIPYCA
jgi:hypothetical protein